MNLFRPRYRDGEALELDGGLRLRLSANPRARRISVRIDAARREAVVVAPSERKLADAVAFARSRADWIAERLAAAPQGAGFRPGETVPLRGRPVRLEQAPGAAAARLSGDAIRAGGDAEGFARRIERFLRAEARRDLEAATARHVATLGLKPPKVSIADPKSRWGSCTPARGTIRYSWRLVLAPPAILDYVAAHEVAHLIHGHHGPEFWDVCERLYPDAKGARRWLKAHGASLHAAGRG